MGTKPTSSHVTIECAVGFFSTASAIGVCSECAATFFQPSAGQTMCTKFESCPAGACSQHVADQLRGTAPTARPRQVRRCLDIGMNKMCIV
jgi:hypothetical protein